MAMEMEMGVRWQDVMGGVMRGGGGIDEMGWPCISAVWADLVSGSWWA